jgi:hypothetical protein
MAFAFKLEHEDGTPAEPVGVHPKNAQPCALHGRWKRSGNGSRVSGCPRAQRLVCIISATKGHTHGAVPRGLASRLAPDDERARADQAAEVLLGTQAVTGPDVPAVAARAQAVAALVVRPSARQLD